LRVNKKRMGDWRRKREGFLGNRRAAGGMPTTTYLGEDVGIRTKVEYMMFWEMAGGQAADGYVQRRISTIVEVGRRASRMKRTNEKGRRLYASAVKKDLSPCRERNGTAERHGRHTKRNEKFPLRNGV